MSTRKILNEVLDLMDDIKRIVSNTNWRDYSEVRVKILVNNKMDELKHVLGELPESDIFNSEEASTFFEKILDKITRILSNLPQDKMPLQFYELELWRLRYASMYALQYGQGGALQVAGAAHALANVLIGIETMDVQELIVDWEHPEFDKRRKLILNYLSSAYLFFFSLSTSLNTIYKHDLEHWVSEGFKASTQYIHYMDVFWDVPKNIAHYKKTHRNVADPNYSPYYSTFAAVDYIITFLLDLQKFFFNDSIKIDNFKDLVDITEPEAFFESIEDLLAKAENYIADFKKHAKEGYFDLNEDPLNDSDIKETIYELQVTKVWIKGLITLYRAVIKDVTTELHILENTVIPELFQYIDKYNKLFTEPNFIESQIADGINSTIIEILLFAGAATIKSKKRNHIEKIDNDYHMFFTEDGIKRYPILNGLYTTLKVTLDIADEDYSKLQEYGYRLIKLSELTLYEPRNSFAYALLGNMLLLIEGEMSKEKFLQETKAKFEELLPLFSASIISELEIYISNLDLIMKGELASFNMGRLQSPKHYDPYSIFIPEISKIAEERNIGELVYIPFNLQSDYLADTDFQLAEAFDDTSSETTDAIVEQSDSTSNP
ncbi:MAG: hypothetical protein KGD64_06055 [Candidatus Heimdallarchaeota archaeon]|nr:hypothetical protein [Candidatus Heimdallarchaeota archaeon]